MNEPMLSYEEAFALWDGPDGIINDSLPKAMNRAYMAGYEQAIVDMQHFETNGVVMP